MRAEEMELYVQYDAPLGFQFNVVLLFFLPPACSTTKVYLWMREMARLSLRRMTGVVGNTCKD